MHQAGQSRALILDDQASIAAFIEQVLISKGWQCTVLDDPTKLEGVLGADYDLVICDFRMPGRSGLEVFQHLRRHAPKLAGRFLLMTGDPSEVAGIVNEFGGVPFLMKPFGVAQLLQAVARITSPS